MSSRSRPSRLGTLARLRRNISLACQRACWTSKPLTVEAAQRILRRLDPGAKLGARLRSQTNQVFPATFRGNAVIAKFAGLEFESKFILRGEAGRLMRLSASGAPVPEVLFSAEDRLRHPFFIARDLGIQPRAQWTPEIYQQCWAFQAELIRGFDALFAAAKLPVMSLEASRESMLDVIRRTEAGLREYGIERPQFTAAIEDFRTELDRFPWIMGAIQPPEPVFDGKRFWAIDWEPARYLPPLKWICDYVYFIQARQPELGARQATYLAEALELPLSGAELQAVLDRWYRFKALEVGVYLLNKNGDWDYFEHLQRTFLGGVHARPGATSPTIFRRAFAG